MSLASYRAAPPRDRSHLFSLAAQRCVTKRAEEYIGRPHKVEQRSWEFFEATVETDFRFILRPAENDTNPKRERGRALNGTYFTGESVSGTALAAGNA